MVNYMCEVKVGEIMLVVNGKNNNYVSYTRSGKVVIIKNATQLGYVRITEVIKDANNFILVNAESIIYDYYDTISYDEFKSVLHLHGFKIGFERTFNYLGSDESQILAYNLKNGVVIVADTFYNRKTFNSINVYCPNVSCYDHPMCFSSGNSNMSVLDFTYSKNFKNLFQYVNNLIVNPNWPTSEHIALHTYSDYMNLEGVKHKCGGESLSIWTNTIERILLADTEIEQILGKCELLKPIFESR